MATSRYNLCVSLGSQKIANIMAKKEYVTKVIQMDKYHPEAIRRFIQFMYTGDYDAPGELRDTKSVDCDKFALKDDSNYTVRRVKSRKEMRAEARKPPIHENIDRAPRHITLESTIVEHMRINAIGDYYRVSGLTKLSNKKISHLFKVDDRADSCIARLPKLVSKATRLTGDLGVLDVFAEVAVQNHDKFLGSQNLSKLEAVPYFSLKLVEGFAYELNCLRDLQAITQAQREKERKSTWTQPCPPRKNNPYS